MFFKLYFDLIYETGPKMSKEKIRKRESPLDTPKEFELGDTSAASQRSREMREQREKEEKEQQQREERERKEARGMETPQL